MNNITNAIKRLYISNYLEYPISLIQRDFNRELLFIDYIQNISYE